MNKEILVLIIAIGGICLCYLYGILKSPRNILDFMIRTVSGVLLIHFVNLLTISLGYTPVVGINECSILVSAVLGIPGVVLLYGVGYL